MAIDLGFILLFVNYLVLAGTFIYAYLKPREWNKWLVSSYSIYYVTYALTAIFVFFAFKNYLQNDLLSMPFIVLGLLYLLWAIKETLSESGGKWLVPFMIYLASIGQTLFWALASPDPRDAFGNLVTAYALGFFVILIGGKIIGMILQDLFPALYEEHRYLMGDKSGLKVLKDVSPSDIVGTGIIYCIWMIVSYFIF